MVSLAVCPCYALPWSSDIDRFCELEHQLKLDVQSLTMRIPGTCDCNGSRVCQPLHLFMKRHSLPLAIEGHQPRDALGGVAQLSSDWLSLPEEEPFHHFPVKGCSVSLTPGEDVAICDYSEWDSRTERQVGRLSPQSLLSFCGCHLVCGGAAKKAPDSSVLKDRAVEVVGHYSQQ